MKERFGRWSEAVTVLRGAGSGRRRAADDRHQRGGDIPGPVPPRGDPAAQHLEQLSSAYLDGLSASLIPSVVREDVWEVFDTLDRSRERYRGLNVRWVTVTNATRPDDRVQHARRLSAARSAWPPRRWRRSSGADDILVEDETAEARMTRSWSIRTRRSAGSMPLPISPGLIAERGMRCASWSSPMVLLTLLLVAFGTFLHALAAAAGGTAVALSGAQGAKAAWRRSPRKWWMARAVSSATCSGSYNAMAAAVNERELLAAELAEEEKLASVGRLASGMAHEINNPLGGMFNALDSLKRYGAREEVRATSIRLLEQGLSGIRDLVRSTLTTYRADQRPRDLTPTDLDDLRLLVKPEARQQHLKLSWQIDFTGPFMCRRFRCAMRS